MSYYSVLGIRYDSSAEEIRRAYRMLAMQWHPDRWVRTPSFYDEAKQKFQQILEAYSVLSDQRKRAIYDAGLYDSRDEEDEGFCEFMQEMVSLMAQVRREGMNYNLEEEFQKLVKEMGESLESSSSSNWYHQSEPVFGRSKPSKRTCLNQPKWAGKEEDEAEEEEGEARMLTFLGSGCLHPVFTATNLALPCRYLPVIDRDVNFGGKCKESSEPGPLGCIFKTKQILLPFINLNSR